MSEPVFRGTRNQDLLNYVLKLRTALREANADKTALRAWLDKGEQRGQP
ncbi:MAG: hypothetical protein LBM00_05980 [Deltaproteobacteria bacterium]|nr:hypothetical protein [Deltaproteobacteria bacterium]